MATFKIRVVQTEHIKTVGFVTVKANSREAAKEKVQDQIDNGEVYDDGTWKGGMDGGTEVEMVD